MTARAAVDRFLDRLDALDDDAVLISVGDPARLRALADGIDTLPPEAVPLRGQVFAVKDNIDVAGLPTTAGCPAFAYRPATDAVAVGRLVAAGAVPVAKTNLDQFATGLVGTRSPYGVPRSPIDPALVPGGSSSGSAVAVARGLVDFALGTDTAGSGRVPAAFCGIVGLKPTVGRVATSGVVPAVRSADCVTVFAADVGRALAITEVASGPDAADAFSRAAGAPPPARCPLRVGVVGDEELVAAGAAPGVIAAYGAAVAGLARAEGVVAVPIGLEALFAVGDLLYGGPLVAQRTAAVGEFIAAHPADVDPVVAGIISAGAALRAVDVYRADYDLAGLRRDALAALGDVDAFVTPTVPRAVTLAEVADDPIGPNADLGRFTTFANLLDLCAVTLPVGSGPTPPGPEASVTVYGPGWSEARVAGLAVRVTGADGVGDLAAPLDDRVRLVVAGAHLLGQPLEGQLTELGAAWEATTTTAPTYRMYALPGGPPHKPALIHDPTGAAIEVDVWRIPPAGLGRFLTLVPPPLALGTVTLADGSTETGFVAEPRAVDGATDITHHGGWRYHLAAGETSGSR